MKTCRKCGETKAFELFPKNKRLKDGHSSWCKSCSSKSSVVSIRKRCAADPEYAKLRSEQTSDCVRKRKAVDPEYAKAVSERSLDCRQKRIAEDPDYAKVLSKRSSDCDLKRQAADPVYKAKRLQASSVIKAKRYTEDPVFAARIRECSLQWARDNRDKCNAIKAKRRAAELRAMPPWYPDEHEEICKLYRRARQLSNETGIPHHVDHIVPLQGKNVSGLHCLANLQILTAQENFRKSNSYA